MYYFVSKIVWFVLEPTQFFILLALLGALLGRARARLGRGLVLAGLAGLIIAGLSPLSAMLYRGLEQRFPIFVDDGQPVHGVITLGGAVTPQVTLGRGQMALNEAGERILGMVELARRYPAAKIVFTGGSGDIIASNASEADMVERTIAPLMPPERIIYERQSRNTVENAEFSAALVRPQPGERWLLVTSAAHMPRAMGIFRKAGWNVTAYPVDFQSANTADDYRIMSAMSYGLRRTDLSLKEWVGMVFAWATGKSDSLFPAPHPSAR